MKTLYTALAVFLIATNCYAQSFTTNGDITVQCEGEMVVSGSQVVLDNIIVNGDFEDGINNWTPYAQTTFNAESGIVESGSGSAYFSMDVSGHRSVGQYIPTQIGKEYDISASFYIPSASPAPAAFLYLEHTGQQFSTSTVDAWTKVSGTFIADSTSTHIRIIGQWSAPLNSYFYVDNVSVTTEPAPPVQFGMYNVYPDSGMQVIADAGFKIAHTYSTNVTTVLASLDAAEAAGVKLIAYPGCQAELCTSQIVSTAVNAYKNHPALYAYYLVDEANLTPIAASVVAQANTWVKQHDTSHPTITSLAGRSGRASFDAYMNTADIISIWRYPIGKAIEGSIEDIGLDVAYIKALDSSKTVWYGVQAFGKQQVVNSSITCGSFCNAWGWTRMPTAEEIKQMTEQATSNGAEVILYYTYYGGQYTMFPISSTWNDLINVVNEL